MKWEHETWSIDKLLGFHFEKQIDLAPNYQRNSIWNTLAQKSLIDTILIPQPIPNFFLLKRKDGCFEMVDGQQRARAIINFFKQHFPTTDGRFYNDIKNSDFLNYILNITKIIELDESESIEKFYSLVNSSGLRLNVPELRKAKYFDTNFLDLCTELAASEVVCALELFTTSTINRMNDVELISELLALQHYGRSDKKSKVDDLFDQDISENEKSILRKKFLDVTKILSKLNEFFPIKKTRFKQRADLYTLFDFISSNLNLSVESFTKYFKILIDISSGIRPTQERCIPLREYAINCVSQSNSQKARQNRYDFFNDLLLNQKFKPNATQKAVIDFFKLPEQLLCIEDRWTVDTTKFGEEKQDEAE